MTLRAGLVTGANGRLGRALLGAAGQQPIVGLDRAAGDITNHALLADALDQAKPAFVINCAAMSDVNACDQDPDAAMLANARGPEILAAVCAARGIPLVHVSTDYVFGGEGHARLRRETDPPAPVNAYGRSKLAGEHAVFAAGGSAVVVRTAWLFGAPGDFLDRMLAKAQTADVIEVTDQVGTPTPYTALAGTLLSLAVMLARGKAIPPLLHAAGAPAATRADWVEEALAEAPDGQGLARLKRVGLAHFQSDGAARPLATPLDTSLLGALLGGGIAWRDAARAWGRTCLARTAPLE